MKYYCLSCKKHVQAAKDVAVEAFVSKNGRAMVRAVCGTEGCGRKLTSFKPKERQEEAAAEIDTKDSLIVQNSDAEVGQAIQVPILGDQDAGEGVYTGEQQAALE